jgi:glycosyltransferase involved in cell wall biosynthesis
MKKPKASFVIPCYNATDTLAETVNSCIVQNEKRIEIICVDDGSTDSTPALFDYFSKLDERFVGIRLPENKGRSHARNTGIEAAKSEIILALDSDDIAMSHRVSETLKYFKKNPNVDIVYGDFQLSNYAGKIEDMYVKSEPFSIEKTKRTKLTFIGHSTMAFRKKVFDKIHYDIGDFCRLGIDDWKLQIDAYKAGFTFGNINKTLGIYRVIPKKRDEERIEELKDQCLKGI